MSREVLDAAQRLAGRSALAGASMDEIAREAGVSRVTLYRHNPAGRFAMWNPRVHCPDADGHGAHASR